MMAFEPKTSQGQASQRPRPALWSSMTSMSQ